MAGDIDYGKASPVFRVRFEVCFYKNLDRLLAGMNFDPYRRVFKIHFVSATVLSSDNRVRHLLSLPLFLELLHSMLLIGGNGRRKRHRARHTNVS